MAKSLNDLGDKYQELETLLSNQLSSVESRFPEIVKAVDSTKNLVEKAIAVVQKERAQPATSVKPVLETFPPDSFEYLVAALERGRRSSLGPKAKLLLEKLFEDKRGARQGLTDRELCDYAQIKATSIGQMLSSMRKDLQQWTALCLANANGKTFLVERREFTTFDAHAHQNLQRASQNLMNAILGSKKQ